ncbi:MAG: peptidoglycan-binding domain-containing protein [Vicinamibacteria bacterium]
MIPSSFCRLALLAASSLSLLAGADPPPYVVEVMDERGAPVKSTLWKRDAARQRSRIGTRSDGVFSIPANCAQGEVLEVEPALRLLAEAAIECPLASSPHQLHLGSYLIAFKLSRTAARKFDAGDWGTAALLYNDVHVRATAINPEVAQTASKRTYEAMGNYLTAEGVSGPISVPSVCPQKAPSCVMTDEMSQAIASFQRQNRIQSDGVVDYKTLRSAAKSDIAPYLAIRDETFDQAELEAFIGKKLTPEDVKLLERAGRKQ